MQRILGKRIVRDLKENRFRYMALAALVIFAMFIVTGLIGAADTIISGTDRIAAEHNVEDGEFTVFVPLTDDQMEGLTKDGTTIEEQFFLEFTKEGKTIRVFKERARINRLVYIEGGKAENDTEIALERRFCEENGILVGDKLQIGNMEYTVSAIVVTPDYDAPYKELSDTQVDSKSFGTAFVTEIAYNRLKESRAADKSEEYIYTYRLTGKMSSRELKEKLKEIRIDADEVDDAYFAEYWENTGGKVDELKKGIRDLYDGIKELRDGLSELGDNSKKLTDASGDLFESYLEQANSRLSGYGIEQLTRDNYQRVLEDFEQTFDSGIARLEINSLISDLRDMDTYAQGVQEYTNGVDQAADGSLEIADGVGEMKEQIDEAIEEEWGDVRLNNMTSFLTTEDNLRIGGAADDQAINKYGGLVAGVILVALFAYVISIFVIHSIEKDAVVIGALYSLGVKRTELMLHFVILPVVVTFFGGVAGTLLGFTTFGVEYQMQDCYRYYSLPELVPMHPAYLILYGVVLPPVIAAFVNYIVIRKKLSVPALKLLRNEPKQNRGSRLDLSGYEFTKAFQIRQILKEGRSAIAVVLGMFISLVLVMMSLDCYVLCKNVKEDNVEDTKFEYMYLYKYPEKTVPEGGEAAYVKTLKRKTNGYNFDVSILGLQDKSKYFDVEVTDNQTHVVISSALSTKFLVYAGDELTLKDEENDRLYSFIVDEVADYAPTFYVFMNIEDARELFGESSDFYNVVFADQELDIDSGRLYSVLTKSQVEAAADIFIDLMKSFMVTILGGSVFIFFVVMYLMMKVMIDRSAFNIAMIKIFGYRKKEIRKLYLDGNFYIIAAGALISCPLAKWIMDKMYPMLCANVSCALNLKFPVWMYLAIYAMIFFVYFVINTLLVRRIGQMEPAEVLKNRE